MAGPARVAAVRAREYPQRGSGVFLNAASWGLVPRSASEAAAQLLFRRNRAGSFGEEEFGTILRRSRQAAARLLGVEEGEIALAPNTSFGVNLGAALAGAGPPGRIVVSDGEFPANVLPWKALEPRGFEVDLVATDENGLPVEERLLAALEEGDVRAMAVSAVQFTTGFRLDLERLGRACRERDVLFCVDAIQALGAVPLNARDCHIDVLACGGQKWLCSPWGSGFAYVRREVQDRFEPPMVGWLSVEGANRLQATPRYELDWLADARKFEMGTLGLQDYLGLARSIEIFLEMGLDAVREHILMLQAPVLEWIESRPDVRVVTPLDARRRAGILSFVPDALDRAVAALQAHEVTFAVRGGVIRFSPHYYNTLEEIEAVVRILDGARP